MQAANCTQRLNSRSAYYTNADSPRKFNSLRVKLQEIIPIGYGLFHHETIQVKQLHNGPCGSAFEI